jgi:dolichol-phosphate mannosyltransferase
LSVEIVIPALNEPYLEPLKKRLEGFKVSVREEMGLSFAVWVGIQESKSNIIVVMDADGSHLPETIPKMLRMLNEDIWLVLGSRYVGGGYSYDSFVRKFISLFYCKIGQIVLRTTIKDCMSGFWVGYKDSFKFNPSSNYKFGLQLIQRYKKHIKECPIIFRKRQSGKSNVKPMQAIQDFFAILRR